MRKKYNPYRDVEYKKKRRAKPGSISNALASALRWKGLTEKFEQYSFVSKWKVIVNEEIASYTKHSHFRGDTSVLIVPSAAHAQQISFVNLVIMEAIEPYLHKKTKLADLASQTCCWGWQSCCGLYIGFAHASHDYLQQITRHQSSGNRPAIYWSPSVSMSAFWGYH